MLPAKKHDSPMRGNSRYLAKASRSFHAEPTHYWLELLVAAAITKVLNQQKRGRKPRERRIK